MASKNLSFAIAPTFWTREESKAAEIIHQFRSKWLEIMPFICEKKISRQALDILGERIKGIIYSKIEFNENDTLFIDATVDKIKQNDGESADALVDLNDFISEHFQGEEKRQNLIRLNKAILETFDRIMYIYAVAYMHMQLLGQYLDDISTPTMINENGEIVPISLFTKNEKFTLDAQ